MIFIPSYNDTLMAYENAKKLLKYNCVPRILIVDDSDDPDCMELAKKIRHKKILVFSRKRSGKWSAWRLALQFAREYDGLVEIDSDVEVKDPKILIQSLASYDVVTAYPEIIVPNTFLGKSIAKVYQRMHKELMCLGKFNMGGQAIALSRKAVAAFLNQGFFEEPVMADDHVIGLAACVLGLRCISVECGLRIRLPFTFKEWIRYRSRHRQAIKWAEKYVSLKTGRVCEAINISRWDIKVTRKYFLKNLIKELNIFAWLFLPLFFLGSVLPIESQTEWTRLKGEKFTNFKEVG
jgi:glycosyltransferase involved in cell wall biosynthesis